MVETMVIHARVFDLLVWLLPRAEAYPRAHRGTLARRTVDAALDVAEQIERARSARTRGRLAALREADAALDRLRLMLRLAHELRALSPGQYRHASVLVAEVGRLLGGWLRQHQGVTASRQAGSSV